MESESIGFVYLRWDQVHIFYMYLQLILHLYCPTSEPSGFYD